MKIKSSDFMIWSVDACPSEFVPWSTDDTKKHEKIVVVAVYSPSINEYDFLTQFKECNSKNKLSVIEQLKIKIEKYPVKCFSFAISLVEYVNLGNISINHLLQQNIDNLTIVERKKKPISKYIVKSDHTKHTEMPLEKEASLSAYSAILASVLLIIAKYLNNINLKKGHAVYERFIMVIDNFPFDDGNVQNLFDNMKKHLSDTHFAKNGFLREELKKLKTLKINHSLISLAKEVLSSNGKIIKAKSSSYFTLTDWIARSIYIKLNPKLIKAEIDKELVVFANLLERKNMLKIITPNI